MTETRVNPALVSHIHLHDENHQVLGYRRDWSSVRGLFKYCEQKEAHPWEKFITGSKYFTEGYWLNGIQSLNSASISMEAAKEEWYKKENESLVRKAYVEVWSSSEKILTKYFDTFEEAKEFCNANFPTVKAIVW